MDETQFSRNTIDGNHSFHYWAGENPQEITQHEFRYRILMYVRFGVIDECFMPSITNTRGIKRINIHCERDWNKSHKIRNLTYSPSKQSF